jgi:type VI secretion system protein ImpH
MEAEGRREDDPLTERLLDEPGRFDFFQAVRLLEGLDPARGPIGEDVPASSEAVRFRAASSSSFPASEIQAIRPPHGGTEPTSFHQMFVNFLGLTGPKGVLPSYFTRLIRARLRRRDKTLRDFLDLLNHRAISLFYRAWSKYRFPIGFERERRRGVDRSVIEGAPGRRLAGDDNFTTCLYALAGLGTGGLRGRSEAGDRASLYYAGLFAHFPRSAVALRGILADLCGHPVEIEQFVGVWLNLEEADRSRLPGPRGPRGCQAGLGVDTVLGERVRDVSSKFRVRVGPLTVAQFWRYLPPPEGDRLTAFCQVVRAYVGPDLDFDVQLLLAPGEWPRCELGGDETLAPRLGWNVWLRSNPFEEKAGDAAFLLESATVT